MKHYLFYDIETSGLNPCFDQILQFAYILTDHELNEIKREEILVKPNRDLVPSPEAMLTHGFSIKLLEEQGVCEYAAIKKIHRLLNTENTISIGYNTLDFDDIFLRFSFYRNLLPVYTHQYASGCNRADLYPMAIIYYLFKKELLNWPKLQDVSTMRLEHLNAANNLVTGNAHDAMVDTEVCLELARIFIKERSTWDYLQGGFNKDVDMQRIAHLPLAFTDSEIAYRMALMFNGRLGAANFYHAPVLSLGQHNHYKNKTLWLRLDSPLILETNLNNIQEKTAFLVYGKKFGESPIILPPQDRHKRYLSEERMEIVNATLKFLQDNMKVTEAIADYHRNYKYPEVANVDIDAALYLNGFMKDYAMAECARFNASSLENKINMLDEFKNNNSRKLALRMLGRNYFLDLPEQVRGEFNEYLANISTNNSIVDYTGKARLTPKPALAKIAELRASGNLTSEPTELLKDLETYLQQNFV